MKETDKSAHYFHMRDHQKHNNGKEPLNDSFVNFVTCEIDTKHINPDDAWQCKPVLLHFGKAESEIRRDYLFDEYVIISPSRGRRPYDTNKNRHPLVETAESPRLDREKEIYSLRENHHWLVKVVENKYPALTLKSTKAHGKQEIIVDTPLANTLFSELPQTQIERILKVYQLRTSALLKRKDIAYVVVFRNDGFEAGASLAHAHSQVIALPIIPKHFIDHSQHIEQYFIDKNKEPIEDIINFERKQKQRVIAEDSHFFVICPYASRFPFEAWLIPKDHVMTFDQLNQSQIKSCAFHLKKLTKKLSDAQISYNFFIENGISPHFRCIIKLYGRSNIWGGLEVATNIPINTVPPEAAAEWYRN